MLEGTKNGDTLRGPSTKKRPRIMRDGADSAYARAKCYAYSARVSFIGGDAGIGNCFLRGDQPIENKWVEPARVLRIHEITSVEVLDFGREAHPMGTGIE